ncbi:MAG: tRNA uridine-5-carboxymethylaminomethyl(34) synthesis GTPase MnmE [Calditrichaeota bacterium]|nr:tRNA uridine-5-carboxymethylaminomethyl(34) synthesis GTPase MnmE [Calditrichota bacterium]
MYHQDDTIAAISTPRGSGGIAVIRISGSLAICTADTIFRGKASLEKIESHRAVLGKIVDAPNDQSTENPTISASILDEVIVVVFRAPNSFTCEDVVEISCHGGQYLAHRILELLLHNGTRMAEPGEFTQRAFLNGRLDLSQAEAVADLISARTEASLKSALAQFQGALSARVKKIRSTLLDLCSLLELELDFAEEDLEFANKEEVAVRLQQTRDEIQSFLATYDRGKILREGAKLVIVGKPNVGKSSLMNALLKEERAIVTDLPGTTRDVLEEQLDIRGVLFRVVDTAGLRTTSDAVEKEGVLRAYQQVRDAEIVLFLFDGSCELDRDDRSLIDEVFKSRKDDSRAGIVVAINKVDLPGKLSEAEVGQRVGVSDVLQISATLHLGFESLETKLLEKALGPETSLNSSDAMVTNIRQKLALEWGIQALDRALASVRKGLSGEFVAVDLKEALNALGEIIGEVTTEDILGNIFSKFCIGK